jgi:hypothetical protein
MSEVKTNENTMTRISTFCVVSSALAVLALSANGASAVDAASPKFFAAPTPKVTVNPVQPKVPNAHGPTKSIDWGDGSKASGTTSGNSALGSATGGGGAGRTPQ